MKRDIIKKQLTSVREIKHEIIEEFGVVYSDRQIRRIMKKLGFGYGKPYFSEFSRLVSSKTFASPTVLRIISVPA